MIGHYRYRLLTLLILCMALADARADTLPSKEQVLQWLKELRPLQKVHYSFPVPDQLLAEPGDALLVEYVRVTHACSLFYTADSMAVRSAVFACERVNSREPAVPASVAFNYHPWVRRFGKKLPPTDFGATHQLELDTYRESLQKFGHLLKEANRFYDSEIELTAILLDSERFKLKEGDSDEAALWNSAIKRKHDAFYRIAKDQFPEARVIWYQFGAVQRSPIPKGWTRAPYHTLDTLHDSFSMDCYRVPEIGYTREAFRRTLALAREHDNEEVVPWVALGAGWRRNPQPNNIWGWQADWNYELVYSWTLGAEINNPWHARYPERFAEWDHAPVVCFYPGPFDARTPHWSRHFVAYVRGANGTASVPDSKEAGKQNGTP